MKFNAVVGNPPYDVMDGGAQSSATPIYNRFVEAAMKLAPSYISMIMKANWYSGGKGLDEFRKKMLTDHSIKYLTDFFDSNECFPGVDISGGICYFLWDKQFDGRCKVRSIREGKESLQERYLLEDDCESFIRLNEGVSILNKVAMLKESKFNETISARKPFGISTNVSIKSEKGTDDELFIYAYPKNGYVNKKIVKANNDWVDKIKVCISYAYGERGKFPYFVIGKPFIAEANTCCSETYLVINCFENIKEAQNLIAYMKTKLFRFLVLLKKNTQHATKQVYSFVPLQNFTEKSDIDWSKSVAEIDKQLYAKYDLTDAEIAFIESMIKPME